MEDQMVNKKTFLAIVMAIFFVMTNLGGTNAVQADECTNHLGEIDECGQEAEPSIDDGNRSPSDYDWDQPEDWRCSRIFSYSQPVHPNDLKLEMLQADEVINWKNFAFNMDEAVQAMDAQGVSLGEGDLFYFRDTSSTRYEFEDETFTIITQWLENGATIVIENEFYGFMSKPIRANNTLERLGASYRFYEGQYAVSETNDFYRARPVGSGSNSDYWFQAQSNIPKIGEMGEFYATGNYTELVNSRVLYQSFSTLEALMVEESVDSGIVRSIGDTSPQYYLDVRAKPGVAAQWGAQMRCGAHNTVPTAVEMQTIEINAQFDIEFILLILFVAIVLLILSGTALWFYIRHLNK